MPYCGICDLGFISDEALECHRSDKKHLSRSEEYQRRVLEAAHCIHVTGFSRNISYEDLNGYFANFGKVLDLTYIDHNNSRWPFAFVKFENLQVASQVLRYKHHCLNGHFLRVQPKRLKFRNPNRLEVSGSSSSSLSTTADNPSQQLSHGSQGKLSKKLKDVKFLAQVDFGEMFSSLIEKLSEKNTIDEQMKMVYEELKLTDDDLAQRKEFSELLSNILRPYFPGSSVALFGSSVNGFGVKGCDIDIFLDISHLMPHTEMPPLEETSNSALKQMIQKDTMPVPMKEFLQLTLYQRIKYLLKILARNLHTDYCNFFPVPSTRCPIVRFSHKKSELICDFSIQNKMVLCNSHLMKFFSQYDNRIQPLVFTIRLWAKSKKIASVGGTRFSSYSLTLMILFFLQNVKPAVIPSIQEVMDSCIKEEEMMIDGFCCSFPQHSHRCHPPTDIMLPPPQNNNKEEEKKDLLLGDLLEKFFDFFLQLNYETTVISPREGKLLSRSEFECSEQLKSFRMSPICVQDPYLLPHNTSVNVTEKIKTDFIREISVAKSKLSQKRIDGISLGLAHILITDELPAEQAKIYKLDFQPPQNLLYTLNFPIGVDCLHKKIDESVRKFSNSHLLWCKILSSFLQVILEEVLLIQCCIEKEHSNSKTTDIWLEEDETGCSKTNSSFLQSDMAVNKIKSMEDEDDNLLDIIANASNNDGSLKESAQIFQKRQPDKSDIREVKRICLKDQNKSESTCPDDSDLKEHSETVPKKFKNIKFSESSLTNCDQCCSDENTMNVNNLNIRKKIDSVKSFELKGQQQIDLSINKVVPLGNKYKFCAEEKQPPDSDCLLQLMCTVRHYCWRSRKKVRQKLLPQWNGNDFELEKKISEHIIATETATDHNSIMLKPSLATFRFKVTPEMKNTSSVCVQINPIMSACKEVSVFYQFLSPFITRMVSSHFVKWCQMAHDTSSYSSFPKKLNLS